MGDMDFKMAGTRSGVTALQVSELNFVCVCVFSVCLSVCNKI